jgi:nucleotide-binding universal stress UspA family protein
MTETPTTWRNISVFLDDTPSGKLLAEHAATLAQRFGALLVGIFCPTMAPPDHAADCFVRGKDAIDAVIDRRRAALEERTAAVSRSLAELAARHGIETELRVVPDGSPDQEPLVTWLHGDLVILGFPKGHGLPQSWTPEKILLGSGVPTLLIPDAWPTPPIGGTAVVAWNGSREARRAIADAMPMLIQAQAVTLLVVDAEARPGRFGAEPGAAMASHLARHGVHVDVEQAHSNGRSVADIITDCARAKGASLIVIGAYSRARMVEAIFGGVTRTLLGGGPLPLLVSC